MEPDSPAPPHGGQTQGLRIVPWLAIALVALAGSVSSLGNGFAYDDIHAIVRNERVHSLAEPLQFFTRTYWPPRLVGGSTLYRPVTALAFALQWVAGGGSPRVFHVTNVVLYLTVCLLVFWLMSIVLPFRVAWLAAALFAAHPVHVEAVANSVGQGELWVVLFTVLATALFLQGRVRGVLSTRRQIAISICYALACLAKDNGLILPGLLLLAELTVVSDPRPMIRRLREDAPFWVTQALVGFLYLVIRTRITGTIAGDYPHIAIAEASRGQQVLTALRVSLEWVRLLLWPAHLQADYSPRDIELAKSFGPQQLAGLLVFLGFGAAVVWSWRRRPVLAFGLCWTALAIFPVSNLVLKAGILLAERTLFVPSVGAMLAVGAVAESLLRWRPAIWKPVAAGAAVLVILGVWRSADRQPVWKDNETLFSQMVVDAPYNYQAHWLYGLNLYGNGERQAGLRALQTATTLFPYDAVLYSDLGDLYRTDGHCEESIPAYQKALRLNPDLRYTRSRMASCYMRLGDYGSARLELRKLVAAGFPEFGPLIEAVDSAAAAAGAFR
jgi:hypothetical protein